MKLTNLKYIFVLFVFIFFNIENVFAQSRKKSNCSYEQAEIYFNSPSIIISEYSPQYYCSDIMYLKNNNLGNLPLVEYKALYPQEMQTQFEYIRKIGITPDIIKKYIDEDDYDIFLDKKLIETYLIAKISEIRNNNNYIVITTNEFEDILKNNLVGDILNKDKNYKSCSIIKDENYEIKNSLYKTENSNYRKIIEEIPLALLPVIVDNNKLINLFGQEVALLKDNRALSNSTREIIFSNSIFEKQEIINIGWNEKICKANTLEEIAIRNSTCRLCPYIVLVFNEISYIFEYVYTNFSDIIIKFIIIWGVLFIVFEFFKGFNQLPFDADFSNYHKTILTKMRAILIVVTVLLLPPKTLFSWTVDPILNLTIGVSNSILNISNTSDTKFNCDSTNIIDQLNKERINIQNEQIVPPIIKKSQIRNIEQLEDSVIISKETMGNIVCFLTNTLEANGRQMTMGEVLMRDLFNTKSKSEHKFLGFVFGIVIFFLYFFISFMISFYVLDGLLQFLKIAIMWPFYIFCYAFNVFNFDIKEIVSVAKNFGLVMINLSVFSMFNLALLNSFYFVNSKENIMQIINRSIETNDTSIITNNIPTDLLSISQFLFIVYCIYYIYKNLGVLAKTYGGQAGQLIVGSAVKSLFDTTQKGVMSVSGEVEKYVKNNKNNKNDDKDIVKEEKIEEETFSIEGSEDNE